MGWGVGKVYTSAYVIAHINLPYLEQRQSNPSKVKISMTSSRSLPANPANPPKSELGAALTEMGAVGTLSTAAATLSSMGVGQVIVASVGASAVTVSLPAVAAIAAAGCLGISVGSKLVKAINSVP
jgi:hypothetical protein